MVSKSAAAVLPPSFENSHLKSASATAASVIGRFVEANTP
jgi:hypothetical protein